MGRDRVELSALFALALTFACGQQELADEPGRNDKSSNSHSSEDADDEADDEDADDEEAQAEEVEEAPKPPPSKDSGPASVDPPAPPPRGLRDAGVASDAALPTTTDNSGFNAGSGELQPDGQTVVYRIPDGTGKKDWNPKAKPIRVKPGMVLRFIDTDKTAKGDGHWLHTFGQPCPHSQRAIGMGYDCQIRTDAPMGIVPSTLEHSPSNFGGRVYIEVIRDGAAPAATTPSSRAR